MKHTNRIVSLLLTACMILSAFSINVAAAESYTATSSASSTTVAPGDTFIITTTLNSATKISGYAVLASYNENYVEQNQYPTVADTSDDLQVATDENGKGLTGSEIVEEMKFSLTDVKGYGLCTTGFVTSVMDNNGEKITVYTPSDIDVSNDKVTFYYTVSSDIPSSVKSFDVKTIVEFYELDEEYNAEVLQECITTTTITVKHSTTSDTESADTTKESTTDESKEEPVSGECTHSNMALIPAASSTCTTHGNCAYYYCSNCEKTFADSNGTTEITSEKLFSDYVLPLDSTKHIHTEVRNKSSATDTIDGYTGDTYCSDCGELLSAGEIIPATNPTEKCSHSNLTHYPENAATCCSKGNIDYYYCADCDKYFTDSAATKQVSQNAVIIAKDSTKHIGGTTTVGAKSATSTSEGYTGDTCCKGCGAVLSYGSVIEKLAQDTFPFTDVSPTSSYYDAIKFTYEKKLFVGTSDVTFSPDLVITRAMFVTVLGRMIGLNTRRYSGKTTFADVISTEYYAPYVQWAQENNIVLGYTDDDGDGIIYFGVDDEITIEQAVVIFNRYAKLVGLDTEIPFFSFFKYTDRNNMDDWAKESMAWALKNEIYQPIGNSLQPLKGSSRAMIAQMIYKFYPICYQS